MSDLYVDEIKPNISSVVTIDDLESANATIDDVTVKFPYVDARAYGALGLQATIASALVDIGSDERTLYLAPGTWNVISNLVIPSNVNLKMERGAVLAIDTAVTATINGVMEAVLYQVFSCTGTGMVVFTDHILLPWWWGAIPSTDKTSTSQSNYIDQAVESLVASTNCTLDFGSASWIIDSPIWISSDTGKSTFNIVGNNATIAVKNNVLYVISGLRSSKPLAYENTVEKFSVIEVNNCSDFSISGLILDGNYNGSGASTTEHSHGISLMGCHRFTIDRVTAKYCQGDGITLSAMNNSEFTGQGIEASNCSDFHITNFTAYYTARNGVSFIGAQRGTLNGMTGYGVWGDVVNYAATGPWSTVHFEVDSGETAYEVSKDIVINNVVSTNGRVHGKIFGISLNATDIVIDGFRHTDTNVSTVSHNMITIGYNNTNIKLSNGSLYKTDPGGVTAVTYGIYIQSGVGSLSTVELDNITIDGVDYGICHDTNTRVIVRNCKTLNFALQGIATYGECDIQGCELRSDVASVYGFDIQGSGIKRIFNNLIVFPVAAGRVNFNVAVSATQAYINDNICIGNTSTSNFYAAPMSFHRNIFRGIAGLTGSFTMAAAATKTVSNVNVTPYSIIKIIPTNAAAATLMAGASSLYVSAKTHGSGFAVNTANGGNAAGTEVFDYEVI